MSPIALSTRSRILLKKMLLDTTPLRVKELADQFNVSDRTIKYDLETIRVWLQEQDVFMRSNPSKGIWIECDESERTELLGKLETSGSHVFVNQHERARGIILDLLLNDKHMTIGEMVKKNDVSRNTILSDLAIAEAFFKEGQLLLERSRFGIRLIGTEKQRRTVLENVIHDLLDGNDMLQIVQGVAQQQKPTLHFNKVLERFLEPVKDLDALFEALSRIVRETESEIGLLLSDRVIIGVFIRLCIAIQRHRHQGEYAEDETRIQESASEHSLSIFYVFRRVLEMLAKRESISLTDDDVWFISLQAIGMAAPFPYELSKGESLPDVYTITHEMIRHVTDQMRFPFLEDQELFNNLLAHMSDKLTKHSYGVVEPNPLLKEIMHSYRTMFDYVKKACSDVLGPLGIQLTDPDIAFVVLHFQTAYERKAEQQKWKALIVCGTGRGTSKWLMTIIENEIKHIQFVAACSVMDVEKVLEQVQVDLVISILPIKANVPVVVVHSIPGKRDFQAIQAQLNQLGTSRVRSASKSGGGLRRPEMLAHDVGQLENMVQDIIYTGYDLSREIIAHFKEYLSDERAEGLTLHLLFMVNRIHFGTAYMQYGETPLLGSTALALKKELEHLLQRKNVSATEGELQAILRYFEPVDKGE
ncbi:BglG family transcription antiterminator [Paenibacillus sp. UNC451MF]|uniref:BglG family transcription antiterminator n=1 Tax=Paenibacillus sp. UNC451MF TaxID=1449063 RepID=UPI001E4C5B81|nr:PRD domain-containing protein [Paenibacillus sp. UNC451MF]